MAVKLGIPIFLIFLKMKSTMVVFLAVAGKDYSYIQDYLIEQIVKNKFGNLVP